jgi:hypothetical protein
MIRQNMLDVIISDDFTPVFMKSRELAFLEMVLQIVPTSAEFPQVCMMRGSRIFSTPKTHSSADKVHLILTGKCIIEHQSQILNAFAV